MNDQLTQLRDELADVQNRLIDAEANLADQLAEINAFEFEFEARVGHLIDKLEALESGVQRYNERIQIARNRQVFGSAHIPVETQYRRTWQSPRPSAPTPPPQPLPPASEAEIKRLYRQLARRFHPDLATDERDRLFRTQKMAAVNDAYAARSMAELATLAAEPDSQISTGRDISGQTEAQLIQVLKGELIRCKSRLRGIKQEITEVHHRPSVDLSLEVKSARRQGRDLLAEMAADIEKKIMKKEVELDMLKTQFDQLGDASGFIIIDRD